MTDTLQQLTPAQLFAIIDIDISYMRAAKSLLDRKHEHLNQEKILLIARLMQLEANKRLQEDRNKAPPEFLVFMERIVTGDDLNSLMAITLNTLSLNGMTFVPFGDGYVSEAVADAAKDYPRDKVLRAIYGTLLIRSAEELLKPQIPSQFLTLAQEDKNIRIGLTPLAEAIRDYLNVRTGTDIEYINQLADKARKNLRDSLIKLMSKPLTAH